MVQLTVSLYVAAFACAQLVYGPLSDRFGRRRVILVGLAIYTVAPCVRRRDVRSKPSPSAGRCRGSADARA